MTELGKNHLGADLIANGLAAHGVAHVFGIVSIHNMPLFDAINRLGKTKIIDVRHEQAGTHAADGYARATGKLGVVIASTGPGASNCVTGLYEAGCGSSRVLLITGQAETAFYGKGLSYVHEAEKQVPMLQSVCRRVESPRHVSQLATCLESVIADIFSGRPAPGALEIPIDLQYAPVEEHDFAPLSLPDFAPNPDQLEQMVERLRTAKRRVIVSGGGVISANAAAELQQLAEKLQAPVITTVDGRGAIAEDHPLSIGNFYTHPLMHAAMKEADVTLSIGTKFAVGVEGRQRAFVPPGDHLQIDIDPNMVGRTHPATIGLQADAALALKGLNAQLADATANEPSFNESVFEGRTKTRDAMRKRLGKDWPQVMDKLREALPRDGICVRDQTISAYNWGNMLFPIYEPRSSMIPNSGAIGPGFPLSIGAAIGSGKKTVVIHGDGGFQYHTSELATAAQYQIPLVICVFNDQGYGVLRWLQDTRFGRINETDLGKCDFAKIADGFGVPAETVTSVAEFGEAIDRGMKATGPYLLDIDMEHFDLMEISQMPKKT